ncbi:MAG: hypothetical protein A2X22_11010 [Bacteroidetes bacterium GWF2_49_14]|nr:MAG: hypothetical protein A2X22_11010 [Bacteroidetes bacterium GWF2_49_14]
MLNFTTTTMQSSKTLTLLLATILVFSGPSQAGEPNDGRFPKDPKVPVKPEYLRYFNTTYEECRADFRKLADSLKVVYKAAESIRIPVPTATGTQLTVDGLYIPGSKNAKNLVIISSGIHGVEGYTGSAIQFMFIEKYLSPDLLKNSGVLLIHGMNPYGFNIIRRVTENNVDMNRNCGASPELFSTKNEGYRDLYGFINPDKAVSLGSCQNRLFVLRAISKIIKSGMPTLRQAVLQGQYEFPEGLYFGGKQFEPQLLELKPLLVRYASRYDTVIHIDLHTGYGERGKMHLFPNPPETPEIRTTTENLFSGYTIDWGDSKDFYTISGDFSSLIGELIPGKLVIPMTLEYGTMDSQTTMGSLRSIQNMILENQGFHHGYKNKRSERKVKEWVKEMYFPSSGVWRTMVMEQSAAVLQKVTEKLR